MKRICSRCNVISHNFNLWCQEIDCPAENATEVFDNGEWFGLIEIIQPVVFTRSAIIYQALRENQPVFLKIANLGCEDKLRKEAIAFFQLARSGQHPSLPVLLPAHPQSTVAYSPYGWTVIGGRLKYYEVFRFSEGETLRNLLFKNPQPWYQHVGWITLSIIDVVYYLHKTGKLHLCLNPDSILIRYDKQGIPRPLLLDLGISESGSNLQGLWDENYNYPAYTAPEIIDGNGEIGPASDVYGIGLLLYEMLAGRPVFAYRLKKDPAIFRNVLNGFVEPTGRIDLKNIPYITERAISRQYDSRYPNLRAFYDALKPNFPPVPAERKPFRINWRIVFIVLGALLAIFLLILFAVKIIPH